jgi:hypothetical protein
MPSAYLSSPDWHVEGARRTDDEAAFSMFGSAGFATATNPTGSDSPVGNRVDFH